MTTTDKQEMQKIIVLDYGSQYNQLITRRIREFGVFSELKSHKMTLDEIKAYNPKAIIISGGPNSVYEDDAFDIDPGVFELGVPVLGICYGMQLMTQKLGGKVEANPGNGEFGPTKINLDATSKLLVGTPAEQTVLMSHSDNVTVLPEGFKVAAHTDKTPIAAIANDEKGLYGVQFHAETTLSEYGHDIIENFVKNIAQASGDWSMAGFVDQQIKEIREKVGDKKVLLGLSGGVDSSVVGVLLQRAIGDQLTSIFVDHGLLRKGEAEQVMNDLGGKFGLNIIKVDSKERFMSKLAGVAEPEKKRKSSAMNLSKSLTMKPQNLTVSTSLLKAHFTLTLSNLVQILHKRSRVTIMLVDFLKTCSLS